MYQYREEEYLSLSGIQHFAYCRRQWALIHIENQWVENFHTADGQIFHKKAHSSCKEKRGKLLITHGLRVSSRELGITGICDVVEFHQNKEGIHLNNYNGLWIPYPVEYKKGTSKSHEYNKLQLCAQAICLEEMLLCNISEGCIYYGATKERVVVQFTKELRNRVRDISQEMHHYIAKGYTPKIKINSKCEQCSLHSICVPDVNKYEDVENYIKGIVYTQEDI